MNTITLDPIEAVDLAYAQGQDTYELMVTIGMTAEEDITASRWVQGDLAIRVDKHYGENTLSKYAAAINVNTSTLKQRRTLSAYYEKDTRCLFPSLGYSHYRSALKLGNIDKSLWTLGKAESKQWPVFRFEQLLNRLVGKRRNSDAIEGWVTGYDGKSLLIEVNAPLQSVEWQLGQRVTLKAKDTDK